MADEKLEQDRYLASIVLDQDRPEVYFAQRLAHLSPVPAPKTYFADYSSASTNFLIITERIEFASEEVRRAVCRVRACMRIGCINMARGCPLAWEVVLTHMAEPYLLAGASARNSGQRRAGAVRNRARV